MSRLRISVFGGVAIAAAGPRLLPLPVSCRPLLACLLLRPRHAVTRAELAEMLWPAQQADAARRCLSTALWRLKQSLPDGLALVQAGGPDELSLAAHAACWVDAHAFERRIEPLLRCAPETLSRASIARLERALRLVRGPALAGLDAEWALIERQRLRSLYCDALYLATMACAAQGDWPRALAWGRLLAREEPLREDVQRALMLAQAHTGDRAGALAQYRGFVQQLARELGIQPMDETQALARQLAQNSAALARPTAAPQAAPRAAAGPSPEPPTGPLAAARRRIGRVQRVLEASQRQLEAALQSLPSP